MGPKISSVNILILNPWGDMNNTTYTTPRVSLGVHSDHSWPMDYLCDVLLGIVNNLKDRLGRLTFSCKGFNNIGLMNTSKRIQAVHLAWLLIDLLLYSHCK